MPAKFKVYYKNIISDGIGSKHGITPQDLAMLAKKTEKVISDLNKDRNNGLTPFRDLPYIQDNLERITDLSTQITEKYENFVIIGVGSPALGNKAIHSALTPYMYNMNEAKCKKPKLFVLDSIDPAKLESFLAWIENKLEKTVFNVISQSGETPETLELFEIIKELLIDKFGKDRLKEHAIITTGTGKSRLSKIADDFELKKLIIPDEIPRQLSILSDAGLLSAAVCGIDIEQILAGARAMDIECSNEEFLRNPAAFTSAVSHFFFQRDKRENVILPAISSLTNLCDWYSHLWAETPNTTDSAMPVKGMGSTATASQMQLYLDRKNDKFFTFIEIDDYKSPSESTENNSKAAPVCSLLKRTMRSAQNELAKEQRPNMKIVIDRINAYNIGKLIYMMQVIALICSKLSKYNDDKNPKDLPKKEFIISSNEAETVDDNKYEI